MSVKYLAFILGDLHDDPYDEINKFYADSYLSLDSDVKTNADSLSKFWIQGHNKLSFYIFNGYLTEQWWFIALYIEL